MHDFHNHSDQDLPITGADTTKETELDPGGQALADALKWVFVLLKICIFCVVILFMASGSYQVEENKEAVVLLFGEVKGVGPEAIKEPGWHWHWPYIEEVIKIPSDDVVMNLEVDDLWYYQSQNEKAGTRISSGGPTLQFVRDGYTLTASRSPVTSSSAQDNLNLSSDATDFELSGIDYNLVHTKWQIQYSVTDPIAFVEQLWNGTEKGWIRVENLLQRILCDAVIVTSANNDIDWIIWDKPDKFRDEVQLRIQQRLQRLNVGLEVNKIFLTDKTTPRQVAEAFNRANSARSEKNTYIKKAIATSNEILNQARAESLNIIANAEAYRKKVVQAAKADASYLQEVLDKIQKKTMEKVPESTPNYKTQRQEVFQELLAVTIDQLYQEMLREVMANAEETFVLPVVGEEPLELRTYISRDASLPPKKSGK
ncbi:MAG: hypothetical protein JW860_01380 [Sedimentisphaerales bacterium]|nr:hypothetical protein [Sedimentisphaerales bacterium]